MEKKKVLRQIARMKKIKNKLNTGEFLTIESNDHIVKRSFVSSRVSKNTTDKQESASNKLAVNIEVMRRKKSNRLNTLNYLTLAPHPEIKIAKSMARKETIDSVETSQDIDPISIKININNTEKPIVQIKEKLIEEEKPLVNLDSEKQIEEPKINTKPIFKLDLSKVQIMAEGNQQSIIREPMTLRKKATEEDVFGRVLTPRPIRKEYEQQQDNTNLYTILTERSKRKPPVSSEFQRNKSIELSVKNIIPHQSSKFESKIELKEPNKLQTGRKLKSTVDDNKIKDINSEYKEGKCYVSQINSLYQNTWHNIKRKHNRINKSNQKELKKINCRQIKDKNGRIIIVRNIENIKLKYKIEFN